MKYLFLLILTVCSNALLSQEITGTWLCQKPNIILELSEKGSFTITSLEQKYSTPWGGASLNESGEYELLDENKAILMKGQDLNMIFDIRDITEKRLIASAGPVAFILNKPTNTDLEKMKADAKKAQIEKLYVNNLRQIASAGQQYILENGATYVKYDKLEGEYFPPIKPVNGENYKGIVIVEEGGVISVTDRDGNTYTFTY